MVSKKQSQEKYGVTERKLPTKRANKKIVIANIGSLLEIDLALVFNGWFRWDKSINRNPNSKQAKGRIVLLLFSPRKGNRIVVRIIQKGIANFLILRFIFK